MRINNRLPLFALLGLICAALHAVAIQANLAGIVDWHKPLIGLPILDPTPPSLVESAQGRLIVSITKSNVFAVLNATDGEISRCSYSMQAVTLLTQQYGDTNSKIQIQSSAITSGRTVRQSICTKEDITLIIQMFCSSLDLPRLQLDFFRSKRVK